jgi:hypothetical protein
MYMYVNTITYSNMNVNVYMIEMCSDKFAKGVEDEEDEEDASTVMGTYVRTDAMTL